MYSNCIFKLFVTLVFYSNFLVSALSFQAGWLNQDSLQREDRPLLHIKCFSLQLQVKSGILHTPFFQGQSLPSLQTLYIEIKFLRMMLGNSTEQC